MIGRSTARTLPASHTPSGSPSVSVVIPCYNYARYLPDSVRSALNQPGVRVQVVVVDDASTDGSAEVARQLAAADSRIELVLHDRNLGHIKTYNDGLARAAGDYVSLLSADDLLTPGALTRAAALFEQHPSVGLVYGPAVPFSGSPPQRLRTKARCWAVWSGEDWLADRCKTGRNVIWCPEAVMRTSVQREIGGYREDLPRSGDFEMWLRAAAVSDVGVVVAADQALYRQHATNMTRIVHRGEIVDLRERLRAFQAVLEDEPGTLQALDSLRASMRRALAREALVHAARRLEGEPSDDDSVEAFVAFAFEIWPAASELRSWRTVQSLTRANGRRSPEVVARRIRRRVGDQARTLRHRSMGV